MTRWPHLAPLLLALMACQAPPSERCTIERAGPQRQITAVSGDCHGQDFSGQDLSSADLSGLRGGDITCPDGTNSNDNGGSCDGHLRPTDPTDDLTDDLPDEPDPDLAQPDLPDDLAQPDLAQPDLDAPDLDAPDLDSPDLTCDLTCPQPPDACDGDIALRYTGPGALTDACACDFTAQTQRTDCAPLGLSCLQAQCGPARQSAGFVRVEPAIFRMGSVDDDPDHHTNEALINVTLTRPFWIKTTEITEAELDALGLLQDRNRSCGPNCPAVELRWEVVARYANALSIADGLPPCYNADTLTLRDPDQNPYNCQGYRLPTEAEWELACTANQPLRFACTGPDCEQDLIWTNNNTDRVQPVAQQPPNTLGLFDLSGNVAEWTHDRFLMTYPSGADPFVPHLTNNNERTLRGGSWLFPIASARCAARNSRLQYNVNDTIGARLARTIHDDQ